MIALPRGEMLARSALQHWKLIHLGAGLQRETQQEILGAEGMTQSAHGGVLLRPRRLRAMRVVHYPRAQPQQSRQTDLPLPPGDTIFSAPPPVPAD